MALATEAEWESDPELKAMRADFVASFAERRVGLEAVCARLREGGSGQESIAAAVKIAHKLAGAAETYGFPTLTRATAAFEGWAAHGSADPATAALAYCELLVEMLGETQRAGRDVARFVTDPRFVALAAAAGG